MMYQQVELAHKDRRKALWLPASKRLRVGAHLTLTGDSERVWEVITLYYEQVPKDCLRQEWKVGKLGK